MLLGVDRSISEARAITNFTGNGVATVFLANNKKDFDRQKMEIAFAKEVYEFDIKTAENIPPHNTHDSKL